MGTTLHKKLTTKDGHKAEIRKEHTPKLMTEYLYHISVFSKEKGKRSQVIHQQTCSAGPELPEIIARGWSLDEKKS